MPRSAGIYYLFKTAVLRKPRGCRLNMVRGECYHTCGEEFVSGVEVFVVLFGLTSTNPKTKSRMWVSWWSCGRSPGDEALFCGENILLETPRWVPVGWFVFQRLKSFPRKWAQTKSMLVCWKQVLTWDAEYDMKTLSLVMIGRICCRNAWEKQISR